MQDPLFSSPISQDLLEKQPQTQDQNVNTKKKKTSKRLPLLPLIFLIYFEVAGGPYDEEPAVKAAGPLLALIRFLVFPFIWSIPEALVTAGNGGFVVWAQD